jgi:hypothetical protein
MDTINGYREKRNLRALGAQNDWDNQYVQFLNKIVLYASWILTTSITWFIALYDKVNVSELKNLFIIIAWFSLTTIISWLFRILVSSKQKFIEANIHIIAGEIYSNETALLNKGNISNWDQVQWKTQENLEKFKGLKLDRDKKHKLYWIIGEILFYISIIFFCLTCYVLLILILNIG